MLLDELLTLADKASRSSVPSAIQLVGLIEATSALPVPKNQAFSVSTVHDMCDCALGMSYSP